MSDSRSVSRVKCTLDSWPIRECCARGGESLPGLIYAKEFYEDVSVKIRGARKRENGKRKCFERITK